MTYTISLAAIQDATQIAEIYRPYVETTPISFEYEAPDAAEIASRMQKVRGAELPWLVAKDGNRVLGYAYATKHKDRAGYQWCVESSVYVALDAHRGGIGRALYTRLFEILRDLGYHNVYAGATLPNEQSEKFHESFGFKEAGRYPNIGFKHGSWHDTVWWYLPLGDNSISPERPRRLDEVIEPGKLFG